MAARAAGDGLEPPGPQPASPAAGADAGQASSLLFAYLENVKREVATATKSFYSMEAVELAQLEPPAQHVSDISTLAPWRLEKHSWAAGGSKVPLDCLTTAASWPKHPLKQDPQPPEPDQRNCAMPVRAVAEILLNVVNMRHVLLSPQRLWPEYDPNDIILGAANGHGMGAALSTIA